ncbi:MAG: zinc-ribbon domain-containing protein [Nitrososphaerales archaeon]
MAYCSNCGKEVPAGAKFCPNCAAPMAFQQPRQADQTPPPSPGSGMTRPRGTRILILVDFIVGIVVIIIGIQGLVSGVGPHTSATEWYAVSAIFAIIGLLSVAVGYGLWKARPWAWLLGLWAGVVYVILGILGPWPLTLVGIVNLLFYYFTRADLKRYLSKAPS